MKTERAGLLVVVLMVLSVAACTEPRVEMQKTLALDPGGEFVLEADAGSVTVTGSSAPDASIVISSRRNDLQSRFNFKFESNHGRVLVTARKKSFHWFSGSDLHFEVTVPTQTRVSIKTGGGSLKAWSLEGDQRLETSGGSIVASGIHGNVVARTSGGSITANSVDGSLEARTSGGSVHIDGLTGAVNARTSGGSIRATLAPGNSQGGRLQTSGGSIRASLDPTANLDIDASTSGGSVSSDLPLLVQGTMSRSSLHGTLGSGGPTLFIHTSGGSIHITSN